MRIALAAAALSGACSNEPDVVVMQGESDGSLTVGRRSTCREGNYGGRFEGTVEALNTTADIGGTIEFTLHMAANGEFATLTQSSLIGYVGADKLPFHASVRSQDGQSCSGFQFRASLSDGDLALATGSIAFGGTIEGTYDDDQQDFEGTWSADFVDRPGLVASGRWWGSWQSEE
jgi:hypothetical protein